MYNPKPIDTSDVILPKELLELTDRIAENVHDVWAVGRMAEGWTYGEKRDDVKKTTPCLVSYSELKDTEKEYDRNTAMETLKLIVKMGYKIEQFRPLADKLKNSKTKCAEVFLSYSHDDRILVEKIAARIIENKFLCWTDKGGMRTLENFNEEIDDAIDKSDIFIAFLSKTYVNKPYCIHEFDRAIDKQKSILVVCIDDVSESTNRQSAYLFSFNAGHNVLGFGTGVSDDDNRSIELFAQEIINSTPMKALKKRMDSYCESETGENEK